MFRLYHKIQTDSLNDWAAGCYLVKVENTQPFYIYGKYIMKKLIVLVVIAVLAIVVLPVSAQDPVVEVSDQVVKGDVVNIASATNPGPSFIVIHADNDGAPGPVIGWAHFEDQATDLSVEIDTAMATPTLYAMLHVDDGEVGVYEFGEVEGADGPVIFNDAPVTPAFIAYVLDANPQLVEDSFTVAAATIDIPGFIVVHANDEGAPGPVLGFAPIEAGLNLDVVVELEGDITDTLFPMMHFDNGEVGVYEFGDVDGADGPVIVSEDVLTYSVNTFPSLIADSQSIVDGTVTVTGALIDADGWVVIHSRVDGAPGPVLGVAPLTAGFNQDVVVEIEDPTTVEGAAADEIVPMLHYDTGEAGEYEFGTVDGEDLPVFIDDAPVISVIVLFDDMME